MSLRSPCQPPSIPPKNAEHSMKISKKLSKQIRHILTSKILSLDNLAEFNEDKFLYNSEPNEWTEFEKDMCDYQARITKEILAMLADAFNAPFDN